MMLSSRSLQKRDLTSFEKKPWEIVQMVLLRKIVWNGEHRKWFDFYTIENGLFPLNFNWIGLKAQLR